MTASHWALRVAAISLIAAIAVSGRAAADAAEAPQPGGVRLVTLGTNGGAIPSRWRAQPASLLEVDGEVYLVDAGNGVLRQLALANVPLGRVHQIFITHNHIDHNADWATLMAHAYVVGRRDPITVHGPVGTVRMRDAYLRFLEPLLATSGERPASSEALKTVFRAQDITAGLVYADAHVRVTAVENCHFHGASSVPVAQRQRSYAYRFETREKTIVFSGDTGPCEDALVPFARNADLLVHEVIDPDAMLDALRASGSHFTPGQWREVEAHMRNDHSTPEVVGRLAARAGVKEVILTHVVTGNVEESNALAEGVRKYFAGPVHVAADLDTFQ